jgi:hypothetical protein
MVGWQVEAKRYQQSNSQITKQRAPSISGLSTIRFFRNTVL